MTQAGKPVDIETMTDTVTVPREGHFYRTRCGQIVGPLRLGNGDEGDHFSDGFRSWHFAGDCCGNRDFDLIEDVGGPSQWQIPAEFAVVPRALSKELIEAFLHSKIYLDRGITDAKGYEKARRKIRYRWNEYVTRAEHSILAAAPSPPDEGREIVRALSDANAKMLIGLICLGDAKAAEYLLSRVRRAAAYIESILPKDETRNG